MTQPSATGVQEAGIGLPSPGDWTVDKFHTTVGFVVRHMVVSKVRGRFKEFDATITVAEPPKASKVVATIDAASVDTGQADRDAHLRSAEFFDVAHFPTMSYVSTNIEQTSESTGVMTGDLTIKGITRPVTLDVEYLGMARDPWGNDRIFLTAEGGLDREDWGLTWNQAIETGGVVVSRQVNLEIEVQAVRSQPGGGA